MIKDFQMSYLIEMEKFHSASFEEKSRSMKELINLKEWLYKFEYYHQVADETFLGEYVSK